MNTFYNALIRYRSKIIFHLIFVMVITGQALMSILFIQCPLSEISSRSRYATGNSRPLPRKPPLISRQFPGKTSALRHPNRGKKPFKCADLHQRFVRFCRSEGRLIVPGLELLSSDCGSSVHQ